MNPVATSGDSRFSRIANSITQRGPPHVIGPLAAEPVWKTRAKLSHALVAIGIGSALKRAGLPAVQDALVSGARVVQPTLR